MERILSDGSVERDALEVMAIASVKARRQGEQTEQRLARLELTVSELQVHVRILDLLTDDLQHQLTAAQRPKAV